MQNSSVGKTDFTLASGGHPVAAPETKETRAQKLSQERTDLQYLEHNLKEYCMAIANLEMILVGTHSLRQNNFDDSKLAGGKIRIPMPNGRNFVHTMNKYPTTEIKEWVKLSKGYTPKLLDAPSQSIKDPAAAKNAINQISEKVMLSFALCYGRAHYLKQADRHLLRNVPQYTTHILGMTQDWIQDSAKALGIEASEIETLKKSAYTNVDHASQYMIQAMNSLDSHKGVLKHLRREIDLRANLLEAQSACLKAGLCPN